MNDSRPTSAHRPLTKESPVEDLIVALRLLPPYSLPDGAHAWENVREALRRIVRDAIERFEVVLPGKGRGIVTCGGGEKYFPSVYVLLRRLRELGCKLPVEVWHLGPEEMDTTMKKLVTELGGVAIDAHEVAKKVPWRILNGWELKPFAIAYSNFQEVLFLDADCIPVIDPTDVFESRGYLREGSVLWPDFTSWTLDRWVWDAFGLPAPPDGLGGLPLVPKGTDWQTFNKPIPEGYDVPIESGQLLIDKSRCALPLRIAGLLCEYSDLTFQWVFGDKETFRMAWKLCDRSYHLPAKFPGWDLHTYLHYHPDRDDLLFAHRSQDKLRIRGEGNRLGGGAIPDETKLIQLAVELDRFWSGKPWHENRPIAPLSIVTALLDLEQVEDREKGKRHYLEYGKQLFAAMKGHDITVYTQNHLASSIRDLDPDVRVLPIELESLEAYKKLDEVKRCREQRPLHSMNVRKDTPVYAIFQQMKIEILRKHATDHALPVWIDLGIGSIQWISLEKLRTAIEQNVQQEKIFFLTNGGQVSRIEDWQAIRHNVLFGVVGGPAKSVDTFLMKVQERYAHLQNMGLVPHDEVVVEDVAAEHPELVQTVVTSNLTPNGQSKGETWADRLMRAKLEVSMAGYYEQDKATKDLARRWCLDLAVERKAPAWIRDVSRGNLAYYMRSARDELKAELFATLEPRCDHGFAATNPSICVHEGRIYAVVRTVNYEITSEGQYIVRDPSNVMRTKNVFAELDSTGSIKSQIPIVDRTGQPNDVTVRYVGFEDCRLFRWREAWWASATVFGRDSNPNHFARIALLKLDVHEEEVSVTECRVIGGPENRRHQKNWMPVVSGDEQKLRFLYSCDPTIVIDATGKVERFEDPKYACDGMRGSSQLLRHEDGYLAVVHESKDGGGKREYYHRFLKLDLDLRIQKIGDPFYFDHLGIEFCAGLAKYGDKILISYGAKDREAKIIRAPFPSWETSETTTTPPSFLADAPPLPTSSQTDSDSAIEIGKVLYINLEHRTDRRNQIETALQSIECPESLIERFDACSRSNNAWPEGLDVRKKKCLNGLVGCAESHRACLALAKARGYESVLILEDDCAFYPRITWESLRSLWSNLSGIADVLLLGANVQNLESSSGPPNTRKVIAAQTAHAYFVRRAYYDTLIANIEEGIGRLIATGEEWNYGIDQFWKRLQPKDQWFIADPILAYQRESWSDCGDVLANYVRDGAFPEPLDTK